MKVLLTGHKGYIGAVAGPIPRSGGHEVSGLDINLFADCDFGKAFPAVFPNCARISAISHGKTWKASTRLCIWLHSRIIHWETSTHSSPTTLTTSRQ
jgi:nucleoside-diphosphate-sugar epimerase